MTALLAKSAICVALAWPASHWAGIYGCYSLGSLTVLVKRSRSSAGPLLITEGSRKSDRAKPERADAALSLWKRQRAGRLLRHLPRKPRNGPRRQKR